MPALLNELTSFWLYSDGWTLDDGRISIEVIEKMKAGPADTIKLEIPIEGYTTTFLYVESPADRMHALLLKPTTIGATYLIFGAEPTLQAFGGMFHPF